MALFAIFIALLLAMKVGAKNSAAEMGAAYGAGIRTKREALVLVAIFVILGAIITGLPVVKTLGGGLAPQRVFRAHFYIAFIVMAVVGIFNLMTNLFKVAVPATYATVGSIVGLGLYYNNFSIDKSLEILKWWMISPFVVFFIALVFGAMLRLKVASSLSGIKVSDGTRSFLGTVLTFSGCYLAFAGGANGAGKAMGPIVAAGIIDNRWGALLGGAGIAAGALIFGEVALEGVEKEIIEVGFVRAILVEAICATVLLLASLRGIPVSVSVTVTSSLIGLGCADVGFWKSLRKHRVIRTAFIWTAIPLASAALTCFLLTVFNYMLRLK